MLACDSGCGLTRMMLPVGAIRVGLSLLCAGGARSMAMAQRPRIRPAK